MISLFCLSRVSVRRNPPGPAVGSFRAFSPACLGDAFPRCSQAVCAQSQRSAKHQAAPGSSKAALRWPRTASALRRVGGHSGVPFAFSGGGKQALPADPQVASRGRYRPSCAGSRVGAEPHGAACGPLVRDPPQPGAGRAWSCFPAPSSRCVPGNFPPLCSLRCTDAVQQPWGGPGETAACCHGSASSGLLTSIH